MTAAIATTTSDHTSEQKLEWLACAESPLYFIHRFVYIEDAVARAWVPFHLWPDQARVLKLFQLYFLVIALKARQIGMTWLALGFALWLILFHPAATVLLFSKRDDEAVDLLEHRLKGMYQRLPDWMKARDIETDNAHEWTLSNGSRVMAFPTTAGDSYTATLVIVDEFDLMPDQDRLMRSVKPTIDNGGRMILLSRVDKSRPQTRFKAIYKAARQGMNDWVGVFLPWFVHPKRDAAWYETQRADILSSTGSLDDLHEQYPATDTEALSPRTLDKRFAPQWLESCYQAEEPLMIVGEQPRTGLLAGIPAIAGLTIYRLPIPGQRYIIGADPAEGLDGGDDSALTVGDATTGEEVAKLAGKFEPKVVFPRMIDQIGSFYNDADVVVERNNHGHAVIGWLQEHSLLTLLNGPDGQPGWLNSPKGRVILFDTGAAALMHRETILHSFSTYVQIASIDKNTLSAPDNEHDDEAYSFVLMLAGAEASPPGVKQATAPRRLAEHRG